MEVLGFYNQRLMKSYKHLLTPEPEKYILSILPLI